VHELYDDYVDWNHLNCVRMFDSGIFPKTAWQVMTDRQATHIFCVRSGRRTAWRYTPNRQVARRRVINASVSAILFRLPGGDEFPPGDTNQFSLIFMIWDTGEVLGMGKEWLFNKRLSVG